MARPAATRKKKKKKPSAQPSAPSWLWLLLGLFIGLSAAAVFHFLREDPAVPAASPPSSPPPPAPSRDETPAAQAPPADPDAPRFDFYTLLPKMEVEIPREKLEEALRQLPKVDRGGTYILQAGSFRDYEDADELKARLALLGIESDIQTVVIKNGSAWHRVRIGPFKGLEAVKPVRRKLKHNHIDFVVIRIGD